MTQQVPRMMEVSAAPVEAPTIPAMPISAKVTEWKPRCGNIRSSVAPNAPPSAAPRKSEGENTPPEAPAPRLTEVASIFSTKSSSRKPGAASCPVRIASIVA